MALDVGELVARLTVDDTRLTRPIADADQALTRLRQVAAVAGSDIDSSMRDSTRSTSRLGDAAQDTARQLGRAGTQGARDIDSVGTSARRASDEVGRIGQAAGRAVEGMARVGGAISQQAGHNSAGSFLSGFADKLGDLSSKTGPVAGSILGIAVIGVAAGAALAAAIQDGLNNELQRDIFQSQTGTTQLQAEKFARAAAESYANVFGESVESNLATVKLGLDYNFIDAGSTQLEAQQVIETLEGVAAVVGTTADETARAIGGLVNSGLVDNFDEAADLITVASQRGLNRQGDLIDSLSEYSAGWKNTGLSAQTSLALIEQSMDLGADNTDRAADAIREFGRRVSEEGDTMIAALNDIGLNGEEMFKDFKRGGDDAEEAFDKAFDTIRAIEDPVRRNTAAVALLGDTSGDFYAALANWDPSEAKRKFGEYEGAAKSAIGVMGDNAATSVEGAMRSIETSIDGLKAALAEAFGPYIQDFADNISNNRAGVISFFVDLGNTAFEAGKQVLAFAAEGMRALGEFAGSAAETGATFLDMAANMISVGESIPFFGDLLGAVTDDAGPKLRGLADKARQGGQGIKDGLTTGADFIEGTLMPGLDTAQARFNEFGTNLEVSARFNDEIAKVNKAISEVGVAADGSTMDLETFIGSLDPKGAPAELTAQVSGLAGALLEQARTGLEAGATVEELTRQYEANRVALIEQLMAAGMSNEAAVDYTNNLGLIPGLVETQIKQPGMPEAHHDLDVLNGKLIDTPNEKSIHTYALTEESVDKLEALGYTVRTLPDGTVIVEANTDPAAQGLHEFTRREWATTVWVDIKRRRDAAGVPTDFVGPAIQDVAPRADGAIDEAHIAPGGGNGKVVTTPLGEVRYAEGETVWEAFIPGAPSKRQRSTAILSETAKRFGFGLVKMADGGILDPDAAVSFAKSKDDLPYSYGGAGGSNWDCSGYMSGIFNALTGGSVRFTTDSDFAAMGWAPGYDPDGFSIGTNNGSGENGHMAGTLFGVNVESGSANGVQYGGPALGATDFPSVWHWPGATGGGMSDEELNSAIDASLNDLNFATTPEDKRRATARLKELDQQKSGNRSGGARGTTDSGVSLSTDGVTKVWVSNWPDGSGGAPSKSASVSVPRGGGGGGGGGNVGGTPQSAGKLAEQPWETPPTPQERLSEWAKQAGPEFASAWGFEKPGGFLGALMGPEVAEAGRNIATGANAAAQSWQPGVQIDNHITVADQDQLRRYEELVKRLLAQFGGAMP